MDLKWLGKIAPTIATALGGPLAGMAVETLGNALGMSNATEDTVKKALTESRLTSDQIAAIQQAEIALKARAQELGLDFEKLAVEDRDSARQMQVATKSRIPAILAIVITVGFFCLLGGMMFGVLKASDNQALLILLGALSAAFGAVVNFFFGSSASSQHKDALLHKSKPVD